MDDWMVIDDKGIVHEGISREKAVEIARQCPMAIIKVKRHGTTEEYDPILAAHQGVFYIIAGTSHFLNRKAAS